MSSVSDNILMWAHYADKHKGFCIEFARQPNNVLGREATHKVIYKDGYPKIYLLDSDGNINKHAFDKYLIKAKDWIYEQEWRIVYGEDDPIEPNMPKISSIIFGLAMPDKNKNTIRNILADQSDIKYRQAEKSENQFKINIKDLTG